MLRSLRLRLLGSLIAALGASALALPAVASAAEQWQRIADPAPGGLDNSDDSYRVPNTGATVAGGSAYLTVFDAGLPTLYRARPGDTSWRQVGLRRRNPSAPMASFRMFSIGGTAWLAWYEQSSYGLWGSHLATLTGAGFRELATTPAGVVGTMPASI